MEISLLFSEKCLLSFFYISNMYANTTLFIVLYFMASEHHPGEIVIGLTQNFGEYFFS